MYSRKLHFQMWNIVKQCTSTDTMFLEIFVGVKNSTDTRKMSVVKRNALVRCLCSTSIKMSFLNVEVSAISTMKFASDLADLPFLE